MKIIGIGEVVWDCFPEGKRLGGAPINFCFFAKELGAESYPVTAIGDDELGEETFAVLKEKMDSSGEVQEKKGKIILATVKGDIHDIGKNIVKVLLENYSFDVIDLGKDVPPETIVDTVLEQDIHLVGLSALMTTTVVSMEETIRQLREKAPHCLVMVGGAVLNQDYADMIGADFYGKDAMQSVHYAQRVFGTEE